MTTTTTDTTTDTPTPDIHVPTMYGRLKEHMHNQRYTRGEYKGDAPADRNRRGKSHYRVHYCRIDDCMEVIFHSTAIIRAFPSGRVVFYGGAYADSVTTRAAFVEAMRRFGTFSAYITSPRVMGLKQTSVAVSRGTPDGHQFRFYDGIIFNREGGIESKPLPYKRCRIDREETAKLAAGLKASGFKDMFPILHAAATPNDRPNQFYNFRVELTAILCDSANAEHWTSMIAMYKYVGFIADTNGLDKTKTWTALMKAIKAYMSVTEITDITQLPI